VKRKVDIEIPRYCTLGEIADIAHATFEAMSDADQKQYLAECRNWREDQKLLAMPLANRWVN
jgi:hypothetical protein